jgi:hypothetical protein
MSSFLRAPKIGISAMSIPTTENSIAIMIRTIYQIMYLPQPIDPIIRRISPNLNAAPSLPVCAIFAIPMFAITDMTIARRTPSENNPDPVKRAITDAPPPIIS